MKQAKRVAFGGAMAALATAIMLTAYFPYLTYAIPCAAGLVTAICVIELSMGWAWGVYAVSAFLTLLFAEPEAKLLYIFFFGYYPILKTYLEKIKFRPLECLAKFAVFNAAVLAVYFVFAGLFGVDMSDMGDFGKYTAVILLALGNAAFFLYDILIDRLAGMYLFRLHKHAVKLLGINEGRE